MAPGKGGYMGYEFYARYDESDRTLEVAWHGGMVFLNTLVSALFLSQFTCL
jgi:hypothetical protein